MPYNSLLLQMGGGISSKQSVSPRYAGSAALCIGIGGTGMRALAALKKKVYDHIEPDDPDSPVKAYSHIQFLGIDSDETDQANFFSGEVALTAGEFFTIKDPSLATVLGRDKDQINNDPLYNWMEIDDIRRLHSNQGAGGVRQIGRYLLFRKAGELRDRIAAKAQAALIGQSPADLDVYIMAGISGGTGSGCFLDTCYIVRDVVEKGLLSCTTVNIVGLFFLPDVVTSKQGIQKEIAQYNRSNGYAAMKELDYLMGLKAAGETFRQDYGPFRIDTDHPPVDMCHLVSATDTTGCTQPGSFELCIETVADYVLSYLADVVVTTNGGQATDSSKPADSPMTIRGNLANINSLVERLSNSHGVDRCYHAVGSAVSVVPFSQFMTYAACGLYGRFAAAVGRGRKLPTAKEVDDLADRLGLTCQGLYDSLGRGCGRLFLTDMTDDLDAVRQGASKSDASKHYWGELVNDWCDGCAGQRRNNLDGLTASPDELDPAKVEQDSTLSTSLVARAFDELCQIALDPERGPYYAAALLRGGNSLVTCAAGVRKQAEEAEGTNRFYWDEDDRGRVVKRASTFVDQFGRPLLLNVDRKNYEAYRQAVETRAIHRNDVAAYADVKEAAKLLGRALDRLYDHFFGPLTDCLDRLGETFSLNAEWLEGSGANDVSYMVKLSDVKQTLDESINALTNDGYVTRFVAALLADPGAWTGDDEERLASLVSRFVSGDAFSNLANQALDAYIEKKYANITPAQRPSAVASGILQPAYNGSAPKFWRNQMYKDPLSESASVSVPANCAVLVEAANNLVALLGDNANLTVRKTGLSDRVTVSRFCSGIPFCAYMGVISMKDDYDDAIDTTGAGSHLYANTGRGTDGSGDHDWKTELPTPAAYSFQPEIFPNALKLRDLYDRGLKEEVIAQVELENGTKEWRIQYSESEEFRTYAENDFIAPNGELNVAALSRVRESIQSQRDARRNKPTGYIKMANNGDNLHRDRVRFDYFVRYRHWQELVGAELESRRALEDALVQLDAIEDDYASYNAQLEMFCDALFFGFFDCTDTAGRPVYEFDRISCVAVSYVDERRRQVDIELAKRGDTTPLRNHPLYRAFLAYNELDADVEPRRTIKEQVDTKRSGIFVPGEDNRIAYALSQTFTPRRLSEVEREVQTSLEERDQKCLMRFYEGLLKEIERMRDLFLPDEWAK